MLQAMERIASTRKNSKTREKRKEQKEETLKTFHPATGEQRLGGGIAGPLAKGQW